MKLNYSELAIKKADGCELTEFEIHQFVKDLTIAQINSEDTVRVLAAMHAVGLNFNETLFLTDAYVKSGQTLDLSSLGSFVVDKHSTGGVGDKISLILVPWLASVGAKVLKLSGRSLGFTGGTIDKLESIPGFVTDVSIPQLLRQVEKVGCGITSASANLCPADKITYALRDANNIIDETGLIAASVLSKKIAGGAKNVVIDLKVGSGAFMKSQHDAMKLGNLLCRLAGYFNIKLSCVLTRMDAPLGLMVGNANEVAEAFSFIEEQRTTQDVIDVSLALGSEALMMANMADHYDMACDFLLVNLEDGNASLTLKNWIAAQTNSTYCSEANSRPVVKSAYYTSKSGWLHSIDAKTIGELARELGAGRFHADDQINHNVGIQLYNQVGSYVTSESPLLAIYHEEDLYPDNWAKKIENAITIEDCEPVKSSCIIDIIRNW